MVIVMAMVVKVVIQEMTEQNVARLVGKMNMEAICHRNGWTIVE